MTRSLFFRCRTKCQSSGELIDVLVIFFSSPLIDINVIDDDFQNALKSREPIPDAVALLTFGENAGHLRDLWTTHPTRTEGLIRRGKGLDGIEYLKEVSIWTFRQGGFEKLYRDPSAKTNYSLDLLALVSRGFADRVDRRGVFQEAPPRHVFRHPSRRQSKHFFVASELLHDEVDAYFAAVLVCAMAWGRLKFATVLHIDTMGIYAIARAVADVAASSGGKPVPWEIASFHSHGGMQGLYRVVQDHEAVLISATTSGAMASKLVEEGVPEAAVVTLLDISDKDRKGAIVYARSRHPGFRTQPQTFDDDTVIELAGEYFVARAKKPRPFTLTKDHRPLSLAKFLDNFSSDSVLRLNGPRKTATGAVDLISVDEALVVESEAFKTWVSQEVRVKTPVSVDHVIHVPGNGGVRMADHCASVIETCTGRRPTVVSAEDLHRLKEAPASGVLICAPVLGNGHVMRSIARDIRELVPDASRHFVVGIGLPETAEAWMRLTQFLTQSGNPDRPHSFSAWLVIPTGAAPGRGQAWERASYLTQQVDNTVLRADSPWKVEAITASLQLVADALEATTGGFLPDPGGSSLKLTRGFVFWNPDKPVLDGCNHAGASLLSMASALQVAREYANPKIRLATSMHEIVILDPENFLRFNDGVLQASILRAAFSHELDYSGSPDLSELTREFLEKVLINRAQSYGEAALEFGLALATKHLRLADRDKRILFERTAKYFQEASVLQGLLYLYWDMPSG